MIEQKFTINGEHGFHLRPAQTLMETASGFQSDILLETADGMQADTKSLLNLMSLGLEKGKTVLVKVNGPDEEQAMQAIARQFAANFGE